MSLLVKPELHDFSLPLGKAICLGLQLLQVSGVDQPDLSVISHVIPGSWRSALILLNVSA
jgi:hypothetical protein